MIERMDWKAAVECMKNGAHVQRACEQGRKRVDFGDDEVVHVCGQEPCFLAAAWTADDRPVLVFRGSYSKVDFVPEDEHRSAKDWVVVSAHKEGA